MYACWRVRQPSPDDPAVAAGGAILRRSGLVAFPTETVYGLGANALDPLALTRIFHAKGRPLSDPLIVHVLHRQALAEVAAEIPPLAWRLAEAFWPGPLTLVLPRRVELPEQLSAGLPTVAVRVPAHPVARALLRAAGVPVAAPSANRFSRPSPTTARHVVDDLEHDIDAVLDGGPCGVGLESTIVRVEGDALRVLRPGGVPVEALAALTPRILFEEGRAVAPDVAAEAPGTLLRHYAPRAPLTLVEADDAAARAWLGQRLDDAQGAGRRVGLLLCDEDARTLGRVGVPTASLGPWGDGAAASQRLYGALRWLDRLDLDLLLGRMPPAHGLGLGVRDRLFRAAEGRVERLGT